MTKKSGLADSPFFAMRQEPPSPSVPEPKPMQETPRTKAIRLPRTRKKKPQTNPKFASNRDTVIPRNHDIMTPSNRDTTQPSYHDTIVQLVRKAVKELGKEAATHRFTVQEKQAVADIIYTYKMRGIRTSENELARIAINFLIHDYQENGENSVLDKVLQALNT
jgi:hypothetical protein